MSKIRSKDTKPEITVRKFLFSQGFRYRLHDKKLPGKPDIVLPKYKSVIMIHGCFWHGHENCKYFNMPKTRNEWWAAKIKRNKQRDKQHAKALRRLGWIVYTIFECELKNDKQKTFGKLLKKLRCAIYR
jgi:DNA mismatch endonuclease (patch repair protein)